MDNKFNNYDVIILSDYNKGVLTTNWFKRPQSAIVFLDPKKSFINFNQCDIITPNLNELKQLSGNNIISEEDIKEYHKLVEKLELQKKKGTPTDDRGPADLTKQIEVLEFRNEKLHQYNEKLIEEVRSLRSKLYVKEN